MNIRDLKYLLAVAKHRNFNQAAQASFVSQPTLSMQIKKLEEELGVQVFERTNKQVSITRLGEQVIERAETIMQHVAELQDFAQHHQDPLAGDVRLGAFPTLAPYFLPTIVPKLHASFPKIHWLLVEDKTPHLLEKLKKGELDMALLALPIVEEGLDSVTLFEDDFLLAVPKGHKLAKHKYIKNSHIKGQSLLLLEDGHCLRDQALDVCSLTGANEHQEFRATSLETLRQMVVANVGVTLMPKMAVRQGDEGVVYLPFKDHAPSRQIGLVWRKKSARAHLIEAVAKLLLAGK